MVAAAEKTKTTKVAKSLKFASFPPTWVVSPLFPPLPQTEPYTIVFGENNRYQFTSGCENPFNKKYKTPYRRGFDIRHYDLIALFMTEFHNGKINESGDYYTGCNNIIRAIGKTPGSAQREYIYTLLDDLWNTNLSFVDSATGQGSFFRALSEITTKEDGGSKVLVKVRLSEEFIKFMKAIEHYMFIRLDVKTKLPSPVAQSIYTYLPSRAVSCTREKPWKISLTKLMEDLRLPVEKYRTVSERKRFFTQHKTSIISQLDGCPVANGSKFRVELVPSKTKKDYNFVCWVDTTTAPRDNKIFKWWIESGGTEADFIKKLSNKQELDVYEIECLKALGMSPKKDKIYFEMIKTLYSGDFSELVGDMHYRYTVNNSLDNPRGYLIWEIRNDFSQSNSNKPFEGFPDEENYKKTEEESAELFA